jgi:Ca-activated chloride channel family protein
MELFERPASRDKQLPNPMKSKLWIPVAALLMMITIAAQTSRTIYGTVTSADDGSALPGVNVVLKGTNTGTLTDASGNYSLAVPAKGGKLVFSYIGLKTHEVSIGTSDLLNVKMEEDVQALQEVVITGGKPQREKKALTGAVSTVQKRSPKNHAIKDSGTGDYLLSAEEPARPDYNTEEYDAIHEQGFRDAMRIPLSTFSIDVDAASYSNVRRFINNGQRPPIDAVRIEEMVNYFDYDYSQPESDVPFSINTEIAPAPWNKKHKLVHIGLQGKVIPTENLPASNLVFLIDVSGSMSDVNKLPLLKSSFKLLVDQLRAQDKVAIVVYAGAAGVVLEPTSGANKEKIVASLDKLQSGGSTAGGEGIRLAYALAKENFVTGGNNRVILATDGDFNVGESSNASMERLVEDKRKDGVFLTVLGYGMGNYKDSKMETLADKGNGNYAYIDSILEAQKVLVNEFGGTLFTIAKDVKIQVEFNPTKVQAYRLIGYENRHLKDEDFNNDKKDAGEIGSGHAVTALYEVIPVGIESEFFKIDELKYQKTVVDKSAATSKELLTVKIRYKAPDGDVSKLISRSLQDKVTNEDKTSENFRWSAAVAGFGMLLRKSEYINGYTFDDVIVLAESSRGKDERGYRVEFINMMKSTGVLASR